MDKITLPLTKDVEQKVMGSVIEDVTKGMLGTIPIVVILMLLFIPDGSSHWSWLTAWFCLGPIILLGGIFISLPQAKGHNRSNGLIVKNHHSNFRTEIRHD